MLHEVLSDKNNNIINLNLIIYYSYNYTHKQYLLSNGII